MRMVFRGYRKGVLQFEQTGEFDMATLTDKLPAIAAEHAAFLVGPEPWLMEVEFLDEPDTTKLFFRIGSDRSRMDEPVEVDPAAGIDWTRWKG